MDAKCSTKCWVSARCRFNPNVYFCIPWKINVEVGDGELVIMYIYSYIHIHIFSVIALPLAAWMYFRSNVKWEETILLLEQYPLITGRSQHVNTLCWLLSTAGVICIMYALCSVTLPKVNSPLNIRKRNCFRDFVGSKIVQTLSHLFIQ